MNINLYIGVRDEKKILLKIKVEFLSLPRETDGIITKRLCRYKTINKKDQIKIFTLKKYTN